MTAYRDKWLVYVNGTLQLETHDFADVERAEREHKVLSFEYVSAEDQCREAERDQHLRQQSEQLQREAEQRAYQRTPEGKHEAALRKAASSPGGVVTGIESSEEFDDLDSWSRERDPLVGEW